MEVVIVILLILAFFCFVLAFARSPRWPTIGWLGLAFWVLAEILSHITVGGVH